MRLWGRYKLEDSFEVSSEIESYEQRARRPLPPKPTTLHKKSITLESTHTNRRYLIINYYTHFACRHGEIAPVRNDPVLIRNYMDSDFYQLRSNLHSSGVLNRYKIFNSTQNELLIAITKLNELVSTSQELVNLHHSSNSSNGQSYSQYQGYPPDASSDMYAAAAHYGYPGHPSVQNGSNPGQQSFITYYTDPSQAAAAAAAAAHHQQQQQISDTATMNTAINFLLDAAFNAQLQSPALGKHQSKVSKSNVPQSASPMSVATSASDVLAEVLEASKPLDETVSHNANGSVVITSPAVDKLAESPLKKTVNKQIAV
ncbi:hypothetical protein BKA69DRAFT_466033 [Paraphysoderma sedebokerense]|nr:hypothetical protein BKA69DRAFT_466033 [Paraphysoderma sedebokerense]